MSGLRLTSSPQQAGTASRPILPPDVPQHFMPIRGTKPEGGELIYAPMLLASSHVHFADGKSGIETTQEVTVLVPMSEGAATVNWEKAAPASMSVADLEQAPQGEARFVGLPSAAGKAKNYEIWNKEFAGWLYRTQKLELFKSPSTAQLSNPGESERDFRLRLQQSGREQRDKGADSLRRKYAPKIAALQERVRRAEQQREKQQTEARSSQMQAAISVGASILGAFLGRKTISATNIGRATTAIRGAGRVLKESQDVSMAQENVAAVQQQLADLEAQFKAESEALAAASDPLHGKAPAGVTEAGQSRYHCEARDPGLDAALAVVRRLNGSCLGVTLQIRPNAGVDQAERADRNRSNICSASPVGLVMGRVNTLSAM